MTWPSSVITRAITFPGSQILETGGDLTVEAVTRASRSLESMAGGFRLEKLVSRVEGPQPGGIVTVLLPVTDRPGDWRDPATGQPLATGPDLHSHLYETTVTVYSGSTVVAERVVGPYPLPTGATPLDSTTMLIPAGTAQSHLVAIPQAWLDIIAAAQAVVDAGPGSPDPDPDPTPEPQTPPFAVVQVVTGAEIRPDATVVAWIGGTSKPTPMGPLDLWWREVPAAPPAPPVIASTPLTTLVAGTAFTQTIAATGAVDTWAVTAGSLPAGLTLDSATGTISGTPLAVGSYTFTLTATNAGGSDTQVFSGAVQAAATAPMITTTTIAGMTVGAPYSQALAAEGSSPITWGVSAGDLPAGIGINSSTGALSGTPTVAGTSTFTVTASNGVGSASQEFTVTVAVAPATESFSVFPWTTSPYAITRGTDGTPNIEIATGFYGLDVAGDLLTKVRLYIPEGPLPTSVTVRAYHPPLEGAPSLGSDIVATGTIASPVLGWNEATLDTPIAMENTRTVWVSYDAGAGVYYAATNAIPDGTLGGPVYLASYFPYGTDSSAARNHFRIGGGATVGNAGTWYGLDVVVEAAL